MSFILYHGAKSWTGDPEVRRAKKNRTFHGSGLYLTTSFVTARKYSRNVYRFEVDSNFTFSDEVDVPLDVMLVYVKKQKMKHWKEISEDIRANARRLNPAFVRAEVIVNLMVNYDSLSGAQGPALANFLVSNGVSGTLVHNASDDWLVVYDMSKIISYAPIRGAYPEADRIRDKKQSVL